MRISPKSLVREIVDFRFDEAVEEGKEGTIGNPQNGAGEDIPSEAQGAANVLTEIRQGTFYRWLAFLFGGLLPTIKLVALIGVPTSKAWGLMFSGSFVVIEMLIVFSGGNRERNSQSSEVNTGPYPLSKWTLNRAFRAITVVGIITQFAIFIWIAAGLMDRLAFGFNDNAGVGVSVNGSEAQWSYSIKRSSRHIFFDFLWDRSQTGLATTQLLGGLLFHRIFLRHINHPQNLVRVGLAGYFMIYILGSPLYTTYQIQRNIEFQNAAMYPLLLLPFWLIISALYFLLDLSNRFLPNVAKYVLPEKPKTTSPSTEPENLADTFRMLAVMFFFLQLILPLLWYAYIFNPRFTYNAKWTAVFG